MIVDEKNEILGKLDGIKDLPTLPQVVLSFQEALTSRYCDATAVTRVVEEDPAIVAKVLRVANSPLFGVDRKTVDVQQAIIRIGFYEVYNIVLAMSTISLFGGGSIDYKRFWAHSISAGFGTGVLARHCGKGQRPLDGQARMTAFTAGLLHDIGLIILDLKFPESFKNVTDRLAKGDVTLRKAEEEALGTNHAEIGGVLLRKWGLAEGTIAGIVHQHDPENAGEHRSIARLVQLSSHICNELGFDNGLSGKQGENPAAAWAELDIAPEMKDAIKKGIKEEAEKSPTLVAIA